MTDRQNALTQIAVGDIFHAAAPNEASLICLILNVTESVICAKRITTQSQHEFDRITGVGESEQVPCTIDSVASLPIDIHEVMPGLDRIYPVEREEHHKLTDDEKRALLFIGPFYRAHPV